MSGVRRVAIVVTPLVAVATLALGLRVGAKDAAHAAIVYGAPKARGSDAFAWQVVTIVDDRGVRETVPVHGVTVTARDATSGRAASWTGDSNADGVAEARLDMPGVDRGAPIELEVRADGERAPLAKGRVAWGEGWMLDAPGPFVRPSQKRGAIALDVAVIGGKLIAGSSVTLAVRATSRDDGHAIEHVTITPEADPGFDVTPAKATTCALGWARLAGSPVLQVATTWLRATTADGRSGEWYGSLPVAAGAMTATISTDPYEIHVHAASERTAYVEIDDDRGRAWAATAPVSTSDVGPQATFTMPPLAHGLVWLVWSSEPRGAETLGGPTIAAPTLIKGTPMPPGISPDVDPCADLAYVALHPAGGFDRFVALDGFTGRAAVNAAKKKHGLAIALGSLAVASLLELLLLMDVAARARADVNRAARALDADDAAVLTKRSSAGSVAIGLLVALLGFGLLAAMLVYRS